MFQGNSSTFCDFWVGKIGFFIKSFVKCVNLFVKFQPFWPIGSGCARGFLGALDAAWMVRSWASGKMTPLEVIAERESIYQLLSQTTPENLNKVFGQHTIDPNTRPVYSVFVIVIISWLPAERVVIFKLVNNSSRSLRWKLNLSVIVIYYYCDHEVLELILEIVMPLPNCPG